jgi:hypothetical protein
MSEDLGGNNAAAPASGPTTFAEAFAPDASPASDPSQQSNDAPAAAQPATDGESTPTADDRSPFIPRSRFDEVNGKYNELKQWREQYGWVEDAQKRAAFEQAVQIGQLYTQDRAGYIRQLLADALNDQTLAPVVRSEAARFLSQGRGQGQAPAAVDLNPIPVQLEDGRTVPLFTAEQHQALLQQELAKFREELAPVRQTAEELKAAKEQAARQQEADSFAKTFFGDLSKLPDFDALKPEIASRLAATTLASDHPKEVEAAVYRIYMDLSAARRTTDIAKAKSEQLDDLRRQAAASTSPNPGSAAPSTTRTPASFYDPALKW